MAILSGGLVWECGSMMADKCGKNFEASVKGTSAMACLLKTASAWFSSVSSLRT